LDRLLRLLSLLDPLLLELPDSQRVDILMLNEDLTLLLSKFVGKHVFLHLFGLSFDEFGLFTGHLVGVGGRDLVASRFEGEGRAYFFELKLALENQMLSDFFNFHGFEGDGVFCDGSEDQDPLHLDDVHFLEGFGSEEVDEVVLQPDHPIKNIPVFSLEDQGRLERDLCLRHALELSDSSEVVHSKFKHIKHLSTESSPEDHVVRSLFLVGSHHEETGVLLGSKVLEVSCLFEGEGVERLSQEELGPLAVERPQSVQISHHASDTLATLGTLEEDAPFGVLDELTFPLEQDLSSLVGLSSLFDGPRELGQGLLPLGGLLHGLAVCLVLAALDH
jgi:hypothetical protein